ncbi:MAG: hypothetical protein WA063_07490 [Minisyncoccia bacterium]
MDLTQNKIAGWALLALGLVVIFWSIYSSYGIFTGKTRPPEIFTIPAASQNLQDSQSAGNGSAKTDKINVTKLQALNPADLQKMQAEQQAQLQASLQNSISAQFEKIVPADTISKLMNLSSWSIFVFILIYAGSKISDLGIKLLRD